MNRIGISLCLIGVILALFPLMLGEHLPANYHRIWMYSGFAIVGIGFGAGLASLLAEPIRKRSRFFFGPYPLLMMYVWVSRTGLVRNRVETLNFVERLRAAGIKQELDFYGQLITNDGTNPELTRIPPAHLQKCAITIATSLTLAQGGNEQVCTYDPKGKFGTVSGQPGQYCNLHVSRKVLKLIKGLWYDAHRSADDEPVNS
jgi:hypothetical protein